MLPLAHLPPRDLGRRAERIERVGCDAAPARLVGRDAEVTELQLLVFTDKDIEWGQVTMQRLATMQHIEGLEDRGDLLADEFLRLSAFRREPRAQVAMLGVFHDQAVARGRGFDLDEAIEHPQRASLTRQELRKVRLAQPTGEPVADFYAHPGRNRSRSRRGREVDLAKAAFADQPIQPIGTPRLGAVQRGQHRTSRKRRRRLLQARDWRSGHPGPKLTGRSELP